MFYSFALLFFILKASYLIVQYILHVIRLLRGPEIITDNYDNLKYSTGPLDGL
jgi:hypothetical protein